MKVLIWEDGFRAGNRVILSGVLEPWLLPGQLCVTPFGCLLCKGEGRTAIYRGMDCARYSHTKGLVNIFFITTALCCGTRVLPRKGEDWTVLPQIPPEPTPLQSWESHPRNFCDHRRTCHLEEPEQARGSANTDTRWMDGYVSE